MHIPKTRPLVPAAKFPSTVTSAGSATGLTSPDGKSRDPTGREPPA